MKFNLLASASSLAMGGLAIFGMPGAAVAGLTCSVLSCTETLTPASFLVNGTQTVAVDQFNLGGGASLTSVIISEAGSFATTGTVTYTGAGIGTFTFSSTGTLRLKPNAAATGLFPRLTMTAVAPSSTYTLASGASASYGGAKNLGTTQETLTSGLGGFIGTGTFLVDFLSSGGIAVAGTSAVATDLSSTFFPSLTITYDFSYPAPEPASLSVVGAAIAGLGVIRRRRKV